MRYMLFVQNDGSSQPSVADLLKQVGLEEHVDGASCVRAAGFGPMGTSGGYIIVWSKPGENPGRWCVKEDDQTWYHNQTKGYYVGWWKDSPPKEADLRRDKTQRGKFIPLGNGESWKITAGHHIDQEIKWGDNWEATPVPVRKYSYFTDAVQQIMDTGTDVDGRKLYTCGVSDQIRLTLMSLQINYFILPEVMNHLGLVTMNTLGSISTIITGLVFPGDDE
jgi:hypothetical protein